jgi:hypothetical protein
LIRNKLRTAIKIHISRYLAMRSPASPPVAAYNICPNHPVGIDGAHEEEDLDEDFSPQIILAIDIPESNGCHRRRNVANQQSPQRQLAIF